MSDAADIHPRLLRDAVLYKAHARHGFCAARIRQKLAYGSNTETLLVEAHQMVRREIGTFPSEDPNPDPEDDELERTMREFMVNNFEALSETESYMWGLGVAGIFHQWERDTREVISALEKNPPVTEKLDNMGFEPLCGEVRKTGFAIKARPSFPHLRTAWLITNTIKHGRGKAFSRLVVEKPELFQGGPVGVRMGNLAPQPQDLRVWEQHFDEVAIAIGRIWLDYVHHRDES